MTRLTFDRLMAGLDEIKVQGLFDPTLTLSLFNVTKKGFLVIKVSAELSPYCMKELRQLGWIQDEDKNVWYFELTNPEE